LEYLLQENIALKKQVEEKGRQMGRAESATQPELRKLLSSPVNGQSLQE
jgi:hypothetical protein